MTHDSEHAKRSRVFLGLGMATGILAGLAAWRRLSACRQPSSWLAMGGKRGTALITGGSSGIGAAFAHQLAARGYSLILVARREERLASLANELEKRYPISAEILVADLSKSADIERIEKRVGQLQDLDILVNNAGFGSTGDFAEVDLSTHVDMINVHVMTSVRLSRTALPGMIARRRGAIINVASVAAFVPLPEGATYSATKAYLTIFSEALQVELDGTGVQVQALCPGFTHTEFHDRPELETFDRSDIPRPLWMSAQEVATESLEALSRNRVVTIPGLQNRLLAVLARNTPLWALRMWHKRAALSRP
jgi:short-subunit dehydrogenase